MIDEIHFVQPTMHCGTCLTKNYDANVIQKPYLLFTTYNQNRFDAYFVLDHFSKLFVQLSHFICVSERLIL